MNVALEWIIVVGVVVFGITYCAIVGFFIHCFNEMFFSILDINEEWQKKITMMRNWAKISQKKSGAANKKSKTIETVRDKDGKSYYNG